jgi:hypothetical protein
VALDAGGDILEVNPFLVDQTWNRGMDMEFGPNGSLYILEYGTGAFGGSFPNSRVTRVDYVGGQRSPIAQAAADPSSGGTVPLTVQFSSAARAIPTVTRSPTSGTSATAAPRARKPPDARVQGGGRLQRRAHRQDPAGKTSSASVTVTVGHTPARS